MRVDARLPLVGPGTAGRAVQSVGGVHPVRPLAVNAYQAQEPGEHAHRNPVGDAPEGGQGGWRGPERRGMNRRVSRQPILVELRSGRDRRRQVQCDDELCAHVDAEA